MNNNKILFDDFIKNKLLHDISIYYDIFISLNLINDNIHNVKSGALQDASNLKNFNFNDTTNIYNKFNLNDTAYKNILLLDEDTNVKNK